MSATKLSTKLRDAAETAANHSLLRTAADEIERLEGELAKAYRDNDDWADRAVKARNDRDFQALVTLTAALLTREGYDAEGAAHDAHKALAAIKEHTDGEDDT